MDNIATLILQWSLYTLVLVCGNQPYTDMAGVAHINANCVATVQEEGQDYRMMVPFRLTVGEITFVKIEPETEPVVRHPNQAYIEIDTEQDYGFAPEDSATQSGDRILRSPIDTR